jgi:hypothetical protein
MTRVLTIRGLRTKSGVVASSRAVAAVGSSIERLLTQSFKDDPPIAERNSVARLVRTEDFGRATQPTPLVSLFLYRVEVNRTMRAAWSSVATQDGRPRLPVELHFLLTAWADSPQQEYLLMGRVLQCLEEAPILTGPRLATDAWSPGDSVQLVVEDMSTDTVMRIFDSLQANYKLSIPYLARIHHIDGRTANVAPPVVDVELRGRPPAGARE